MTQPPDPERIPTGSTPSAGCWNLYFMGPHWGDEGGLVFKRPFPLLGEAPTPTTSPSCQSACAVQSSSKRPHPFTVHGSWRAGGEAISMAASQDSQSFCPQLAATNYPHQHPLPALADRL